jgi:nanoRNase/pAp phosphatase (c-di-AMP/oligoRNAs hydrolase)
MPKDEKPPSGGSDNKRRSGSMNGYSEFHDKMVASKGVRVAIFTHRCPDPDAMASMMGLSWLLEKAYDTESVLFYAGEVSHPQNGVMLNLLNPDLHRVEEAYVADDYGLRILVDTIPENAGTNGKMVDFDIVIDHHRELPSNFDGVLIHKKIGACASIIFDMMKHLVKEQDWLDEDSDSDQKLATALISGIVTDTEFMMSEDSTEFEFGAFSELFRFRNSNFLKKIAFFKRPKFWIDKKAQGCTEARVSEDGFAIVGLGIIPDKHRDLIADMADEMLNWTSVETAIAFGVVGGDKIEGSVRSLNASLTVSDFCKKLGGKHGSGGGKHGKGAYCLPLAGMSIDSDEEEEEDILEAWDSIKNRETKRIVRTIKK